MDKLLVILRQPPYGTTNAAEAVRHAGGAGGFDYQVILYLIDGGVFAVKSNQDTGDTGFTEIGESIELLSDEMEVYVHKDSLNEYGLKEDNLIDGIKIDNGDVLKQALKESQSVMIF